MIDPLSVTLTVAVAAVALAAGWLEIPRPPELDGERWFKIALCTLIRGRVEAAGGGVEQFEAEVLRTVPYHPAGRLPERKVSNPVAVALPARALDGELALLEALAARATPGERLAWMYDADERGRAARLSDPHELGEDYGFGRLGPGASWDTLAAWGGGASPFAAAARRAADLVWVLVEGRAERRVGPSVLDAIAAEWTTCGGTVVRIERGADGAGRLRTLAQDLTARLVLVGEEAGVSDLLRWLADDLELRDRTLAVLSLGGVIGGRSDEEGAYGSASCQDWLGTHFGQVDLDTEVVRRTPYFAVQWLDRAAWPPGAPGLPLQASRFPEPHRRGTAATMVEVVDLGPLWVDAPPPLELVARAAVAVVCGWIASRR